MTSQSFISCVNRFRKSTLISSPTDSLQWPLQDFVVVSDEKKVSCEFFITTSVGTDTLYLSTEIATVVGNERKWREAFLLSALLRWSRRSAIVARQANGFFASVSVDFSFWSKRFVDRPLQVRVFTSWNSKKKDDDAEKNNCSRPHFPRGNLQLRPLTAVIRCFYLLLCIVCSTGTPFTQQTSLLRCPGAG